MKIKNWGPDGIARVAEAACHRAERRLVRMGCEGEAARMFRMCRTYRRSAAELIVSNLGALVAADARQIIRELSGILARNHLEVERASRIKRQNG